MPPEDRLRRDQRRDLREHSTSQALAEDGETPPFVVTQLQASTVQLSLENPVLLAQEFDHVPLLPFDPSEQRRDKEIQRNHRGSLRHCLVDPVLRHYGVIGPAWAVPMDVGGRFSGTVTGVMNMAGALAASFTPIVYGSLFGRGYWVAPFVVSAAVMAAGAFIWIFLIDPGKTVVSAEAAA